jgi:hypothetical protein
MPWDDPRDKYKPGAYYQIDDRTGKKVRSTDTHREWTGLQVEDPDPRHPQEFVRGKRDYQAPPNPSPENTDTFISIGDVTPDDL